MPNTHFSLGVAAVAALHCAFQDWLGRGLHLHVRSVGAMGKEAAWLTN